MSSLRTLKSASQGRVRTDITEWQASGRIQGHFYETCPVGASYLMNDIYGRPVNQNTLDMRSAECSARAPNPQGVVDHIQRENNERPYIPIASSGMRGAGDFMGKSRDLIPQDLYADGTRGNFVRLGSNSNHLPSYPVHLPPVHAERRIHQQGLPSHDTESPYFSRG